MRPVPKDLMLLSGKLLVSYLDVPFVEAEQLKKVRHCTFQCSQFHIDTAYAKLIIATNKASIHRLNGKTVEHFNLCTCCSEIKQSFSVSSASDYSLKHGHQAVVKQIVNIELSVALYHKFLEVMYIYL